MMIFVVRIKRSNEDFKLRTFADGSAWAPRPSCGERTQPDIFLPDRVARRIMPVSTVLLVAATGLALWRQFTHRWRAQF
jgi:hypothetical protein